MEPLVINGRRRGVVRRALVGLALTAGCVYALVQGVRYTHIISLLLGILGAPFLGLLTIGWIRLLGPIALVVDDRGMMDSTSALSVCFIPWGRSSPFFRCGRGAEALDDGVTRRPASGRRRAHGEQHIVRGGELA